MAKKEPELNIPCPRCGKPAKMTVDLDLKAASNVTVMECPEEECQHRFAKDQSVKLSGTLVLEAAECMESIGGYTSLGEFVRETIRARTATVSHNDNLMAFGAFLNMIAEDPETWKRILEDDDDEVDE
jgi:hypothetical protein